MTGEQRGPEAEIRAQMDALGAAVHKSAMTYWNEVIVPFAEAYGRAAGLWQERNRPLFEALGRLSSERSGALKVPPEKENRTLWLVSGLCG